MDEVAFLETGIANPRAEILKVDKHTVAIHSVGFIYITTTFSFDIGWEDD